MIDKSSSSSSSSNSSSSENSSEDSDDSEEDFKEVQDYGPNSIIDSRKDTTNLISNNLKSQSLD
jgi:hypothetical protein